MGRPPKTPAQDLEKSTRRPLPGHIPTTIKKAMTDLEKAAGGRDGVLKIFQNLSPTDDNTYLFALLSDPRYKKRNLSELCALAGVGLHQFLQLLSDAEKTSALRDAMKRVWKRYPEVVEGLAERALPQSHICFDCEGGGADEKGRTLDPKTQKVCKTCLGKGQITIYPDLEVQVKAIQLGGLLKPGALFEDNRQVTLNQNNNTSGITGEMLADFRAASDRLLYPGRERGEDKTLRDEEPQTVEAEVVTVPAGTSGKES